MHCFTTDKVRQVGLWLILLYISRRLIHVTWRAGSGYTKVISEELENCISALSLVSVI